MTVPYAYDTVSYDKGNQDGKTFCGTNSEAGVEFIFTDSAGEVITLDNSVFSWNGNELSVLATKND